MSRPTKERLEEIREWPSGVYGAHKDALFEEIDALAAENAQLKQLQTAERKAVDALTAKLEACKKERDDSKFIAGNFECKKCGFYLVKKMIYMKSANIGPNNEPENCANGCGPMWKVSKDEYIKTLLKRLDAASDAHTAHPLKGLKDE